MLKRLKNIEFSKKLLIFVEVLVLLCFCLTLAAVIMGDASALVALITGVFSLASFAFGFYFWKAKNENIRKYAKSLNKDQIDQCVKIAGILLKESEYDYDKEDI